MCSSSLTSCERAARPPAGPSRRVLSAWSSQKRCPWPCDESCRIKELREAPLLVRSCAASLCRRAGNLRLQRAHSPRTSSRSRAPAPAAPHPAGALSGAVVSAAGSGLCADLSCSALDCRELGRRRAAAAAAAASAAADLQAAGSAAAARVRGRASFQGRSLLFARAEARRCSLAAPASPCFATSSA